MKKKSYVAYLAGSMHGEKDGGKGWRDDEKPWLERRNITFFSPPDREASLVKKLKIKPEILTLHTELLKTKFRKKLFTEIRLYDLLWITQEADFVILNYTRETAGTCSEATWAASLPTVLKEVFGVKMRQIPVHIVNEKKLPLNPWLESCCESEHPSFKSLHKYLTKRYNLHAK